MGTLAAAYEVDERRSNSLRTWKHYWWCSNSSSSKSSSSKDKVGSLLRICRTKSSNLLGALVLATLAGCATIGLQLAVSGHSGVKHARLNSRAKGDFDHYAVPPPFPSSDIRNDNHGNNANDSPAPAPAGAAGGGAGGAAAAAADDALGNAFHADEKREETEHHPNSQDRTSSNGISSSSSSSKEANRLREEDPAGPVGYPARTAPARETPGSPPGQNNPHESSPDHRFGGQRTGRSVKAQGGTSEAVYHLPAYTGRFGWGTDWTLGVSLEEGGEDVIEPTRCRTEPEKRSFVEYVMERRESASSLAGGTTTRTTNNKVGWVGGGLVAMRVLETIY